MAKKSKSNKVILLSLIGIGGVMYVWLRSQLNLISFGSITVPLPEMKIRNGAFIFGIRLPILNASALAARVTGFTGFITSPNGSQIGTVFLSQPAVVQRYQQNELKFAASVSLSALLTEIGGSVLTGGQLPTNPAEVFAYLKNFELVGQLRIYGLPLPIKMPLV